MSVLSYKIGILGSQFKKSPAAGCFAFTNPLLDKNSEILRCVLPFQSAKRRKLLVPIWPVDEADLARIESISKVLAHKYLADLADFISNLADFDKNRIDFANLNDL